MLTSEYHDAIWERVDDARRSADAWLARRAESFADGADAVLDLGCGDGVLFAALGSSGARVHGADRSAVALARAARRFPDARLHAVDADERLPLDDNCVERVWMCGALEHVVDTQVVLSEARRVLVPAGRLLVITPDHPLRRRLRLAFGGWERHFDPFSDHLRFYTGRSLSDALEACGFDVRARERHAGLLVFEALRA